MFVGIDHVAMSVKDIERAIAFYRDAVGMEKVLDVQFGENLGRVIGVEGTQARVVHMKLGGVILELFDYAHPQGRDPRPDRQQSDFGLTHFGFQVTDFWATYQGLVDRGVRPLGEPIEIRPNVFIAYFHGIENEVFEIREVLPK